MCLEDWLLAAVRGDDFSGKGILEGLCFDFSLRVGFPLSFFIFLFFFFLFLY